MRPQPLSPVHASSSARRTQPNRNSVCGAVHQADKLLTCWHAGRAHVGEISDPRQLGALLPLAGTPARVCAHTGRVLSEYLPVPGELSHCKRVRRTGAAAALMHGASRPCSSRHAGAAGAGAGRLNGGNRGRHGRDPRACWNLSAGAALPTRRARHGRRHEHCRGETVSQPSRIGDAWQVPRHAPLTRRQFQLANAAWLCTASLRRRSRDAGLWRSTRTRRAVPVASDAECQSHAGWSGRSRAPSSARRSCRCLAGELRGRDGSQAIGRHAAAAELLAQTASGSTRQAGSAGLVLHCHLHDQCGCVIVDPATDTVVGTGCDATHLHPLQHAGLPAARQASQSACMQ